MTSRSLLLLCSSLVALATGTFGRELPAKDFTKFSSEQGIRVVFFYRARDLQDTKGKTPGIGEAIGDQVRGASWEKSDIAAGARLSKFFAAYGSAAEVLDKYGVKVAKVVCEEEFPESVKEFCGIINVGYYVQCFKNGELLLEWPIENMFEVDSIVSNVLDVMLRDEIPTLQTKQCRRNMEVESRGKKNFLVGYFKNLGTAEHRNFLEVGHELRDTVDFAVTLSQRAVNDLPWFEWFDGAAIWAFYCKEAQGKHGCQVVKYMGCKGQDSLRNFVNLLDLPATHDVTDQGDLNPYEGKDIHQAIAFYDSQSEARVKQDAMEGVARLRGLLGILLVNVDETDASAYGYDPNEELPTVALKIKGSDALKFKPGGGKVSAFEFVAEELGPLHPGLDEFLRDDFVQGYERVFNDYHDRSFEPHVEKEDSPLCAEEWRLKWEEPTEDLDTTHLPSLTDVTFEDRTINSDVLIVLFHVYMDQRNIAVYRSFLKAANILGEEGLQPFATMECFDWTHVCRKEDMFLYPSIRVYRRHKEWVTYDGVFSTEAFVRTAKLYMALAPKVLTTDAEARRYMNLELPPDMGSFTNKAVLGLFDDNQKEEISSFKDAAAQAHGKLLYAMATGDLAQNLARDYDTQVPAVLVYKRDDKYQPLKKLKDICPVAIERASLPLLPELTAENFIPYLEKGKPLAILFSDETDSPQHDTVAELIRKKRFPNLVLAWMNADKPESPGGRVLLDYDSTAALPAIVFTDRKKGEVFLRDEIAPSAIEPWIQDVVDGKVPRRKGMNAHVWKARNPGYNFLKFVDDVEAANAPQDDLFGPQAYVKDDHERRIRAAMQEDLRQDLLQLGLDPERKPGTQHTEL